MSKFEASTQEVAEAMERYPSLREFFATAEGQLLTEQERGQVVFWGCVLIDSRAKEGRATTADVALWQQSLQTMRGWALEKTRAFESLYFFEGRALSELNKAMAYMVTGRCMKTSNAASKLFADARASLANARDEIGALELLADELEAERPATIAAAQGDAHAS